MSTDRLYSNPDLTRAGLAEKLATNEHYIADAIREGSDGKTFLQFVNMYRLSSADELFEIGWEDYLRRNAILAVEWSENVEDAFDGSEIRIRFEKLS